MTTPTTFPLNSAPFPSYSLSPNLSHSEDLSGVIQGPLADLRSSFRGNIKKLAASASQRGLRILLEITPTGLSLRFQPLLPQPTPPSAAATSSSNKRKGIDLDTEDGSAKRRKMDSDEESDSPALPDIESRRPESSAPSPNSSFASTPSSRLSRFSFPVSSSFSSSSHLSAPPSNPLRKRQSLTPTASPIPSVPAPDTEELIPSGITCDLLAKPLGTRTQRNEVSNFITNYAELFTDVLKFKETEDPYVFIRIDPVTENETTCQMLKMNPDRCLPNELEIHQLPILGHGVFARTDLPGGTYLAPYHGITLVENPGSSSRTSAYVWELFTHIIDPNKDANDRSNQESLLIDGKPNGNYTKLINSSETKPNVEIEVVSVTHLDQTVSYQLLYRIKENKPVKKGQQLLVRYGGKYWKYIGIEPLKITPKTFTVIDGKACKWDRNTSKYVPVNDS